MIIPIGHEDQRGRRWPWVTIVIIALNVVIFLATHDRMEAEGHQAGQAQLHILILSARYPDTQMPPDVAQMVESFKREHARAYAMLASNDRKSIDPWDAKLLSGQLTPTDINAEMASLAIQLEQIHKESLAWNYAFHPYHPTLVSYITADFLHGGWEHLIFNMWFLWLAGVVLEDAWGRVAYPIFYLVAGVVALVVHAGVFRGSFVPVVGASGAIAGLMGAFLARFPKTRIKMAWLWWFRIYKFYVPAYVILPLWLAIQVTWGILTGSQGGVAYWAHVGGFAFGMVGAVILRASGLEHTLDQAIEAKVSWTAEPQIVRATEHLGDNRPEAAIAELQQLAKEKPDSIDAQELLLKAQQRTGDTAGQKESLTNLCRLCVASDPQTAWDYYEQFNTLGGEKLPRGVWMELCRYLESKQNWDRAVTEYQRLAEKNPTERASIPALVSAARICLTKLHRYTDAERLYRAAQASPIPHVDLEPVIQEGLKQCAATAPAPGTYTG
jgi:membrane associated rhomboid family serine protease